MTRFLDIAFFITIVAYLVVSPFYMLVLRAEIARLRQCLLDANANRTELVELIERLTTRVRGATYRWNAKAGKWQREEWQREEVHE